MTPRDLARAAIEAANDVERARHWGTVDDFIAARKDARAAGLVECWLTRETVEAVRKWHADVTGTGCNDCPPRTRGLLFRDLDLLVKKP